MSFTVSSGDKRECVVGDERTGLKVVREGRKEGTVLAIKKELKGRHL